MNIKELSKVADAASVKTKSWFKTEGGAAMQDLGNRINKEGGIDGHKVTFESQKAYMMPPGAPISGYYLRAFDFEVYDEYWTEEVDDSTLKEVIKKWADDYGLTKRQQPDIVYDDNGRVGDVSVALEGYLFD